MTEAEWLASDDPGPLVRYLAHEGYLTHRAGRASPAVSDRKLRLLACAFARQAWDRIEDAGCRRAVRTAERYADGEVRWRQVLRAQRYLDWEVAHEKAWVLAWACCQESRMWYNLETTQRIRDQLIPHAAQVALLRCVVGNPFRPLGELTCGQCNGRVVQALALGIYVTRDFITLPVLADALEEAGCPADGPCPVNSNGWWQHRDIVFVHGVSEGWACETCGGSGRVPNPLLAHLRGPGPHARGCWALDLILGKD